MIYVILRFVTDASYGVDLSLGSNSIVIFLQGGFPKQATLTGLGLSDQSVLRLRVNYSKYIFVFEYNKVKRKPRTNTEY
jgi:hypothetical protein